MQSRFSKYASRREELTKQRIAITQINNKNKVKSFRFALLMSIISVLFSIVAFAGTTYAWFTTSTVYSNNVIKGGTLSIVEDGDSVLATSDEIWEPASEQEVTSTIRNDGNLWLKYDVILSNFQYGAAENKGTKVDLSEVIDVYTKDNNDEYVLRGNLKSFKEISVISGVLKTENDDNEEYNDENQICIKFVMEDPVDDIYQDCSVSFDIVVKATQFNYEKDLFDNSSYDDFYSINLYADEEIVTRYEIEESELFVDDDLGDAVYTACATFKTSESIDSIKLPLLINKEEDNDAMAYWKLQEVNTTTDKYYIAIIEEVEPVEVEAKQQ